MAAEGYILDFELSGREQEWLAARRRNRVKMIPPVLLRGEDNSIIGWKQERSLRRQPRKGIVRLVAAVPDLPPVAGCGIRYPNRPGHDASRNQG